MCGGAIISDFIPSNRVGNGQILNGVPSYHSKSIKTPDPVPDLAEDDFEVDFRELKDKSDEEEDVKPFSFPKLTFSFSSSSNLHKK